MQAEFDLPQPKTAAGPSPPVGNLNRSGASENDEFYFPQLRRDRSAPPTAASDSAERVAAWMKDVADPLQHVGTPLKRSDALRMVAGIEAAKNTSLKITNGLIDKISLLQNQSNTYAADAVEQKKIVDDRDESIRELHEQLADLMGQLRAKDSLIEVQQKSIKALATTPVQSPNGGVTAGPSTGSLDIVLARGSAERAQLPPRPQGPLPTWRAYGKRPVGLAPNKADDVFVETNPTLYHQIKGNQGALVYQKSLQELLSSCFNQVEYAVRNIPILDMVPKHRGSPTFKQRQVIKKLQDHLDAKKPAYDLFRDLEGRYWAVIGLISNNLVDTIFTQQIIDNKMTFAGQTYIKAFEEERETAEYNHPKVNDLGHRNRLAEQRASSATALVRKQGFRKWLNSISHDMTRSIVQDLAVCFPGSVIYALTQELHKPVSEALRIAVRMRQEPNFIEYNFPPTGTPWNSKFHIHRNTDLMGQTLSDDKSPYCVQVAIMPLIKSKSFANNAVDSKIIHKAEVVVGDREELLRAVRFQR